MELDDRFKIIAYVRTGFATKFGIPRQPARVPGLSGRIVFEPEFRSKELIRGLEGFSHIWVIWHCSLSAPFGARSTVRPPRLGGNERVGVFATRSPFRPNRIGLSCVKINEIVSESPDGPYISVSGADMADGTPVLDIKPYLPYADSFPDAACGFAEAGLGHRLRVDIPPEKAASIPPDILRTLEEILAEDPRPAYSEDRDRIYGFGFAGYEIKFRVAGDDLEVTDIFKNGEQT